MAQTRIIHSFRLRWMGPEDEMCGTPCTNGLKILFMVVGLLSSGL